MSRREEEGGLDGLLWISFIDTFLTLLVGRVVVVLQESSTL